jgi:hypothetical protein
MPELRKITTQTIFYSASGNSPEHDKLPLPDTDRSFQSRGAMNENMKTLDAVLNELTPERQARVRDRAIELVKAEHKKREEQRESDAKSRRDSSK